MVRISFSQDIACCVDDGEDVDALQSNEIYQPVRAFNNFTDIVQIVFGNAAARLRE